MEQPIVARYVGTVKAEPPTGKLKEVDHGVSPLKPEPKRRKLGCLLNQKRSPNELQPTPVHEERCCNCTKSSTCSTLRCECRKADRRCLSCDCLVQCRNADSNITPQCKFITTAPEDDDLSVLAKVLNFEALHKNSKTQTKDEKDDNDAQTKEAESAGSREKEKDKEGKAMESGDLPDAIISEADGMMDKVYGDHVHQNSGQHLKDGVSDDAEWQDYWRRLIVFPSQMYDVPSGAVGKRFLEMVVDLLEGIHDRRWNSERFIVFQLVILQRSRDVKQAKDIRKRMARRMDAWSEGKFSMLVQDTERALKSYLSTKQGNVTPEQRAKIFHGKMLRGDVRGAVRYLTARDKGSVLMPDKIDEKSGDTVAEVLASKHPEARMPVASSLHQYANTPDFVDVDVTEETVEKVARRLSGSAGVGGTDSHALQHWLLRFGAVSRKLRAVVAKLVDWLSNSFPPWAAYRAIMAGRLCGTEKGSGGGVRPLCIGEIWRRLFAKCLLLVAGSEAKEACGIDQLCAGLEAGIEGGIHAMQHLWAQHQHADDWGFLLIDAKNAFNEQNRTAMLWAVRHEWPSGARFVFNCYRHWSTLILRSGNGTANFLHSKEGVSQGDPLSMFAYGLGILPLIRQLKADFPEVEQPWYADDAGAGGNFSEIRRFFSKLEEIGPNYGYYPEPSKSILVVRQHNLEAAKRAFPDFGFKVTTGSRYLGGFIGEDAALKEWLAEKTEIWEEAVVDLAAAAPNFPQAAYAGLQKSLQQEWQFVQRVTKNVGPEFEAVELALSGTFLPTLFGDDYGDDDPRRNISCLPVKWAGLAIPNPTSAADANYEASILICSHILAAFRGVETFRSAKHTSVISEVKTELKLRNRNKYENEMTLLTSKLPCDDRRTILRGQETGQWLSVLPSTVNGTELSAVEFRDALNLRYARTPGGLQSSCDGCNQQFSVRHALECKKGGLVISRHNEIRDELIDIASKAYSPSAVRDEPKIQNSRNSEEKSDEENKDKSVKRLLRNNRNEDRGDILIRGLWARGTDCIIDVRVTDVDAKSNRSKDPLKVLAAHEREKKKKYLGACLEQRRHFSPFVVSTDGLLGKEAKILLKKLSLRLAEKWEKPYSEVCGFVNARMSIAIVRATHLCLRGSRIPTSKMCNRLPQWEDKAGLGLFRR